MARPLPHRTKTHSQLLNLSAGQIMGNPGSAPHPLSVCDLFGRTPEALSDVSRQKLTKGPRGTTGKRLTAKDNGHEKPLWGEEDKERKTDTLPIFASIQRRMHTTNGGCEVAIDTQNQTQAGREILFYSFPKISLFPQREKQLLWECVCVCVCVFQTGTLGYLKQQS